MLTPLVSALAPRIGGVDEGGDRPRVHERPTPRIGGLAIVAGILGYVSWARRVRSPLAATRRTLKEDAQWAKERLA